jgi:hypothetical protein
LVPVKLAFAIPTMPMNRISVLMKLRR